MPYRSWPASLRVLMLCLAASLALHVLVFAFFPEWMRTTVAPLVRALEVSIAPVDSAPVILPPRTPPEVPRRVPPAPQAVTQPLERLTTEHPVIVTQPHPAAPSAFTVPVVPSPPAVETQPAPVARLEAVTPPAFNAAYLRNPPPRYPLAARRSGVEGTVILRVLVAVEGTAMRVELDRSSGSAALDGAALEAVRDWQFVPARRGTQNIEGWVRVPVVFRLES